MNKLSLAAVRWKESPNRPGVLGGSVIWLYGRRRSARVGSVARSPMRPLQGLAFTELQSSVPPASSCAAAWISLARIGRPARSSTRVTLSITGLPWVERSKAASDESLRYAAIDRRAHSTARAQVVVEGSKVPRLVPCVSTRVRMRGAIPYRSLQPDRPSCSKACSKVSGG